MIEPGIYSDMSNAVYHGGEGVGNSVLSAMSKSPAHCYALYIDPDRPERESVAAFKAGTLAHCAVLEPLELMSRYTVRPEGIDLRTKEGKSWAAGVDPAMEIITATQHNTAISQRKAVHAAKELHELLSRGQAETSAFWIDNATGLLCKCRPDWVHPLDDGCVILLDLKTTIDASPAGFPKSIWNYGYHRQAAWYSNGYEKASGKEVAAFIFAAVTSDYPFLAAAYMLDETAMRRGADECRKLLDAYADCKRSGIWPGYSQEVQLISLPNWATKEYA
jgi:hypothetical protein